MHLQNLKLANFRSFKETNISFCRDLTIFVGENNGGKSNAIDAIRLLTTPLVGRRDNICESTDIRFGSGTKQFEIEGRFAELSVAQQGRFISAATDSSLRYASFNLTYGEGANRPAITGGKFGSQLEPGCHDMVRHVYLPPLRDAKRALASGNPTRILALLHHFLDGTDSDALAAALARQPAHPILTKIDDAVEIGLKALTTGGRRQAASVGFSTDEKLIDIARDLRFKLADHGVRLEDLRYSGHGYANLLYMAAIAVELEKVSSSDLTIFLVEEPEAHLHPQLQAAVLCFLEEQSAKSRAKKDDDLGPAGELQVVVATHSPNLSAWVESRKLVVFKSTTSTLENSIASQPSAPGAATASDETDSPSIAEIVETVEGPMDSQPASSATSSSQRLTHCIPISELDIPDRHRKKIDRYLDVTKSALLFGGRIILVEGIAETLLIPIMAKLFVLNSDVEKYRLFRSAVFVPIDGVDFEPYARLLLTARGGVRVADRLVIVTDGDKKDRAPHKTLAGEVRRRRLINLSKTLDAENVLFCARNTYSFESELFLAGNGAIMRDVYLRLRPRSRSRWDIAAGLTGDDQAHEIQKLFDDTRKGDFAQLLAEKISEGNAFVTPSYIKTAIQELVR